MSPLFLGWTFTAFFIISSLIVTFSKACPQFENYSVAQRKLFHPQLRFSGSIGIKKHVSFIDNENSDNSTVWINNRGIDFNVDCWAPFPIDFDFKGHVSNNQARARLHRTRWENGNFCYRINVTVTASEQATGNYSCFPVDRDPNRTKSIYIFSAPIQPQIILKKRQNEIVQIHTRMKNFVVPCPVANPHRTVILFHSTKGKEFEEITTLEKHGISYNPKIGFIFDMESFQEATHLGKFQCRVDGDKKDFLNVTVVYQKYYVEPRTRHIRLETSHKIPPLTLLCLSTENVTFNTKLNIGKEIKMKNEVKISNTAEDPFPFHGRLEIDGLQPGDSGHVTCQNASSGKEVYMWTFAVPITVANKNARHEHPEFLREIARNCQQNQSSLVCHECNSVVECQITQCLNEEISCAPQCTKLQTNGIIQCLNSDKSVTQMYFKGFKSLTYYTLENMIPQYEILQLQEDEDFHLSFPSRRKFICEGHGFLFSTGFQWQFLYDNGTTIQIDDKSKRGAETWGTLQAIIRSTLEINVADTLNTTRLECRAPKWNSTQWLHQEIKLNKPTMLNTWLKSGINPTRPSNNFTVIIISLLILLCIKQSFRPGHK